MAFILFVFFILSMFSFFLPPSAKASPAPLPLDVKVYHKVEIRNSGLLIINDTVRLSPKPGESVTIQEYALGFPYAYQYNLDYAFAYENSNPNAKLKLQLNSGLGKIGFYGVTVAFPQPINLTYGQQYDLTVVFVFSHRITLTGTRYNASFPAYPSLTQNASEADLSIIFPTGLDYVASSFQNEGVNFTSTITDSKHHFNYLKNNLTEFSDQTGWFVIAESSSSLELLEVNEVRRDIEFSGFNQISVTDFFIVVSRAEDLANIRFKLPKEAFSITAFNDFGLISADNMMINHGSTHTNVTIDFATPYNERTEARFAVNYQLPWKNYANAESWNTFTVSLSILANFEWTIRRFTTNIILPEGATLVSSPPSAGLYDYGNDGFRSSFIVLFQNYTLFHTHSFDFKYMRVVFWESFRPTLWMGALVLVICAIVGAWSVYRPSAVSLPTTIISIRVEEIKSFINLYDQRRRRQREIESLDAQAQKGKISRRRYRVRRRTIESRLTSLSRDLVSLREKIRMGGPRYAELMRQLEVAETTLKNVDANLARAEVRYRRGEISVAAYHKLLEDSSKRRDQVRTTIDGVLLRLREEIS